MNFRQYILPGSKRGKFNLLLIHVLFLTSFHWVAVCDGFFFCLYDTKRELIDEIRYSSFQGFIALLGSEK